MIVPKRFVSICARKSDIGVSSTDERLPYPALLITTSSAPKAPIAAFTALAAADSSVTSSAKSLIWSPWRSDRSCRDSMSLAVANTLLPAARPASTIARPRPRELPVTNQTCAIHPPIIRNRFPCRRGREIIARHCLPASADRRAVFRLDDHIPRINFMKCSILFVTCARSGLRFCPKQIPQKNVMMRSARDSLSLASPRAAVKLLAHACNKQVLFVDELCIQAGFAHSRGLLKVLNTRFGKAMLPKDGDRFVEDSFSGEQFLSSHCNIIRHFVCR